jgi:hypothetical protein
MKNVVRTSLITTIIVTLILFAWVAWLEWHLPVSMSAPDRIQYSKLHVELFKAILVGFSVALIGILIPVILSEARLDFQRLKDSRSAYSDAKTGFDYLALRLCTLRLKDAALLIQSVHVKKHMAELYDELDQHLKKRGIRKNAKQWGDFLYKYLYELRHLLEQHAASWDSLTPETRLALLRSALPEWELGELEEGALDAPPKPRLMDAGATTPSL